MPDSWKRQEFLLLRSGTSHPCSLIGNNWVRNAVFRAQYVDVYGRADKMKTTCVCWMTDHFCMSDAQHDRFGKWREIWQLTFVDVLLWFSFLSTINVIVFRNLLILRWMISLAIDYTHKCDVCICTMKIDSLMISSYRDVWQKSCVYRIVPTGIFPFFLQSSFDLKCVWNPSMVSFRWSFLEEQFTICVPSTNRHPSRQFQQLFRKLFLFVTSFWTGSKLKSSWTPVKAALVQQYYTNKSGLTTETKVVSKKQNASCLFSKQLAHSARSFPNTHPSLRVALLFSQTTSSKAKTHSNRVVPSNSKGCPGAPFRHCSRSVFYIQIVKPKYQ